MEDGRIPKTCNRELAIELYPAKEGAIALTGADTNWLRGRQRR